MAVKPQGPGRILGAALKNLFRRPATIPYTGGTLLLDSRNRGLLLYDASTCINCTLCMKDCPTNAITIVNRGTKAEPEMHAFLDTGRCIFCCQCVYTCPKQSLSSSSRADLAELDKSRLRVELRHE